MVEALLEAKLHLPQPRPARVVRQRLDERLDRVWTSTVTLVSAPAGFGKTTSLVHWWAGAAGPGRSLAWVSLDERDNDPVRFWRYLLAAVRRAAPGTGDAVAALLDTASPSTDTVVTGLLNDLHGLAGDLAVVLDDYHVIDDPDVRDSLALLVENLPQQAHLVIASRADPSLALPRLRARGQLLEVRAADLRFTTEETATYLDEVVGLSLSTQQVDALDARTEGWIAALQLAGLSLQGRDDVAGFIEGFAGDDRYVVDYLAEEVLQRQPEDVRSFLLRVSVLARLSGPLCDAVTGQGGGTAKLVALERANLFLVPLDHRRQWYRFHHLFADVLRSHLLEEAPDQVPVLHARACDWFEQSGAAADAIQHALAGGDHARAAGLVELALPRLQRDRQEATLRRWLELLPDEVVRARPVLSNGYAGVLLSTGQAEGVEPRLRDAERWLAGPAADGPGGRSCPSSMVVVDDKGFRDLPGGVAVHRAGLARMLGDADGTVAHAQRALELLGDDDDVGRGAACALLGLACWSAGDLEGAHRRYTEASASLARAGHLADVVGCAIILADLDIARGRLRAARSTYQRGLDLALTSEPVPLRGAADMHVGLGAILVERGERDVAVQHLRASDDLGEHLGLPQNRYRRQVVMARAREVQGDLDGAAALLDAAERVYVADFSPPVRPIAALRARVRARQGRWREALVWVHERDLSADDDLSYLHEFEHLVLARILLAQHSSEPHSGHLDAALGLLERLAEAGRAGGRDGDLIEILVVRSLADQVRGDTPAALETLRRALVLAEPEHYIRTFLDEGRAMTTLLRAAGTRGSVGQYVRRLLAVADAPGSGTHTAEGWVAPLSDRERDVLRLLRSDLGGPDIARELSISLNTLRTHTRNIYAKLGASNRRSAVRRAEELGLLRVVPHDARP